MLGPRQGKLASPGGPPHSESPRFERLSRLAPIAVEDCWETSAAPDRAPEPARVGCAFAPRKRSTGTPEATPPADSARRVPRRPQAPAPMPPPTRGAPWDRLDAGD